MTTGTRDQERQDTPEETALEGPSPNGRTEGRGGLALLRVLRHHEFALFWVGQTVSLVGMWMQSYAQGLIVADTTNDPFALGLVNFSMSLPTLLLMPFGGVIADRLERRRILIYSQWIMLALAALTGWLIATRQLQLSHLYGIALLLGVVTAFELPAFQSFYPQLVDKKDLPQAISLNQATFNGARIIGPALAAVVVGFWGKAAAFYANALSYLAVIAALSVIRPRPAPAAGQPGTMGAFMREGFRYVLQRPKLMAMLGLTGITTFFIFPNLAVLMPHYALHVIGAGAGGQGILMSVSGAGSFLGAMLLLSVPAEQRIRMMSAAAGAILVTMSVLAWSNALWLSVGAVAVQSLAIAFSVGMASIIVQEAVPDALRGRVMSLYSLMFMGIMPFSALAIPLVARYVGMRWELQAAGVCYAVGALLLLSGVLRRDSADPA